MPLLDSATARETFERELERVRRWYGCYLTGYVVMPEHVHLLISEPERSTLSVAIQMLKQMKPADALLASSLLQFSCLERTQTRGKAAIYPPKSGEARSRHWARGLALEQLPAVGNRL